MITTTRVNLQKGNKTDLDMKKRQNTHMRATIRWASKMDMVSSHLRVEINILDSFRKINIMETAHSNIVTVEDMKVTGFRV